MRTNGLLIERVRRRIAVLATGDYSTVVPVPAGCS
jgi:hypothetical protein